MSIVLLNILRFNGLSMDIVYDGMQWHCLIHGRIGGGLEISAKLHVIDLS